MHPAFSVIFFTTASGAGFGALAWLGLLALCGALPPRARRASEGDVPAAPALPPESLDATQLPPLLRWLDRALSR